jgi:hypothetical protein
MVTVDTRKEWLLEKSLAPRNGLEASKIVTSVRPSNFKARRNVMSSKNQGANSIGEMIVGAVSFVVSFAIGYYLAGLFCGGF